MNTWTFKEKISDHEDKAKDNYYFEFIEDVYDIVTDRLISGYTNPNDMRKDIINFLNEIYGEPDKTLEDIESLEQQNKRYREALSFVELELYEVLHENKELNVKMFHIENAKRMITKVLNEEE